MFARRVPYLSTLVFLWALLFLARLSETQLKMDAMTYAALAKHVLMTGDWKTLHYTSDAYRSYYQHPPLVMWLQAIVFKLLGVSVPVARLLPAGFALGTIVLIYHWGALAGSPWLGFMAGVCLLFPGTYLKYASDLMLDGPLVFWMVGGALIFLALERDERNSLLLPVYGLCLACGLLTKGVVVLALPGAALIYALLTPDRIRKRLLAGWVVGALTALMWLVPWLRWGDGLAFIEKYYQLSVSDRLRSPALADHFLPLRFLLQSYWPWLPFFLWGIWRRRGSLRGPLGFALLLSLTVLGGFCLTGHFLEHYLVPFFPFAALIAALPFESAGERTREQVVRSLRYLALVAAVLAAILPIPLRAKRNEPMRLAAEAVAKRCRAPEIRSLLVSDHLSDRWLALACGAWETDWDVRWVPSAVSPRAGEILLIAPEEKPAQNWHCLAGEPGEPFQICEPAGSSGCR